jgi:uncharacterized protein
VKYLLDVNALLAGILAVHTQHQVASRWVERKALVTCPLSELGFLRISTNPRVYNLSMSLARQSLAAFLTAHGVESVPADLPALKSKARHAADVTDCYLADLAAGRGMKLATLDSAIVHPAAELIV